MAFGVVFAMMTGNAKDFYLPGMLYTLGLALAYIITTLAGVPLIGLILGPVFKENLSWRTRNPGRKKAYAKASWAWGLILLAKCAILFPLYWWADTTQLGWVLVALKIPPFLLAVYLTWVFLAKAPAADRRLRRDGGGGARRGGAQGGRRRDGAGAAARRGRSRAAGTDPTRRARDATVPGLFRRRPLSRTPGGPASRQLVARSSRRTDSRSSSCSSRAWAATKSSSSPASRESSSVSGSGPGCRG